MSNISQWHEWLLTEALARRETDPDFRFCLRTSSPTGLDRFGEGYWFLGNERYMFFPPFKLNDNNNKTRTIGFVVAFDELGQPARSYLEVVFGAIQNLRQQAVHERIVEDLGPFRQLGNGKKYQRDYQGATPADAFREFMSADYPRLRATIRESGEGESFFVSERDFDTMLQRVLMHRSEFQRSGTPATLAQSRKECQNIIFYGPPGTGKTHQLRQLFARYTDMPDAVDREAWLHDLVASHGWRSVVAAALADLGGRVGVPQIRAHPWVQAKIKERGRTDAAAHTTLWRALQAHTPETVATVRAADRRPPFIFSKNESSEWELLSGWEELDDESAELLRQLRAGPSADGEAVRRYRIVTFHPSYSYEDFVRGIRPVAVEDGITQFRVIDGIFKQLCDEAKANPSKRYALFIDEINRANIAKVFGELISLLESDKRVRYDDRGRLVEGMAVYLPGGESVDVAEPPFGVPSNLDLFGTMNTADRSIALLDVALRRRFRFIEMEPDYSVLDRNVGAVHLASLLRRVNERLEYLLDRDHRIGHAYLMAVTSLDDLCEVFQTQIIPLLQEYFFDDLAKIGMVLSTGAAPHFIAVEELNYRALFSRSPADGVPSEHLRHVVTPMEDWTEASFSEIYAAPDAEYGGALLTPAPV